MRIGVHGREMAKDQVLVVDDILRRMVAHGLEPRLTKSFATWLEANGSTTTYTVLGDATLKTQDLDLFIGLGGDGTLLDTVAMIGRSGIPLLGMNLGRLGFLSSVRLEEVDAALEALTTGKYSLQDRSLLEVTDHPDLLGSANYAFNEISIHKRDSASMLTVHVNLGDSYLNTYWADGLIISTPTGSTAYSLSCGGPILYPTSDALVINPIAPHNLNVRPFVVPDHFTIRLEVEARRDRCLLNLDSRSVVVDDNSTVTIRRAPFSVKLVQLDGRDFLQTLRDKLNWGLDVRSARSFN